MTHQAPTERDIDEVVDDILMRLKNCAKHEDKEHIPFGERCITRYQAKQAIATHYRQKFEEMIGEDEDIRKKTSFQVFDDATRIRNEFRAQLRAKLEEEL